MECTRNTSCKFSCLTLMSVSRFVHLEQSPVYSLLADHFPTLIQYDDGYCPWSCFNLPLPQPNTPEYHRITQRPTKPSIPSVEYPPDPLPPTTPFTPIRQVQGFKPRIMSQVVKLYDSTISIAVPLIANAAIIGLLARAQVGQAPVNPPLAQEHTRLTLPYMVSSGAFDTDYLRYVCS